MFKDRQTFLQILGSNIHFQKIPKSNHTVNLYSEFSCKSRFAKVYFAVTSYLWTSLNTQLNFLFRESTDRVFWQLKIRILIIFNVNGPFFNKMQQMQFSNWVKKTENRNRKNRRNVKKQYLHNLNRTSEEILKVRIQKFLGCRGYLHKAKSLCKRPLEDASSEEMQGL